MADSAAATAAPCAGVKGASAGPWWKALTSKKKHKDAAAAPPPPAAPGNETPAEPPSPGGCDEQPPHFGSGETAGAGGAANRRSLRVSHSGRFKERRKVRTSLLADSPEVFDGGGAPSRSAPGGK